MVDIINDFFSHATNCVSKGKFEVEFSPINKLLIAVLDKLKEYGYVYNYEIVSLERGGKVKVFFSEYFNKGNAIKPRFPVGYEEFEKYEKRYLPARGFGILLVSTNKGIKTNEECKKEKIGGVLIAYVF
ncbi:30S ribosomal protein S8 [Nanoarchaeota archaeon NZ13-N]|uniref:30S ribosomal protein S8 n=1 Tax=Candidatus Nanoclepta minutus TaxID=1940235 RepID=A0A397WN52_9ARCH|nr:MAG: 30S ribosomal protein S8 [Nanoarchaeota archaeon NZ13-N]RIB35514.1 MAG: 30S ribosomal protein S8 [Candidatus Nanoclepta minutus]